MRALLCLLLLPLGACSPSRATQVDDGKPQTAVLTPLAGQVLRVMGPSQILPGTYLLPPLEGALEEGVIRLSNLHDVTVDLRQVALVGTESEDIADRKGVGLLVESCEAVTILGGTWIGYATPIQIRACRTVRVLETTLDGFWGTPLESTVTRDSQADWLQPEDSLAQDRGGMRAGIEIFDSADVLVQRSRARHGAIGLWMSGSKDCLVAGNDFSFLSAYGVVIVQSSDNTVGFNSLEYNVRGYSHGTYASGQNSAAVLIGGASLRNRVAFNRMTHCGSGVFLFGTADSRPRDNRLFGNDCQYAVYAGVQTRQSLGTTVQNNQLSKAIHFGLYSQGDEDMVILGNEVADVSGPGIALFSSAKAVVFENQILRNQVGLEIAWGTADGDAEAAPLSGASRDHHVLANRFDSNGQDLVGRDSQALAFAGNQFLGERQRLHVERIQAWLGPEDDLQSAPEQDTVVGWLAGSNGVMPTGNLSGVSLKLWGGTMPASLEVAKSMEAPRIPGYPEGAGRVLSEYQGGVETIELGLYGPWDFSSGESKTMRRQPGGLFATARWQARWFPFDPETQDPRGDLDLWRALGDSPILRRTVDHFLEPRPGAEIQKRVPPIRFGLIAETEITVPETASYRLSVMSDDGIRIWFGDQVVFEDWTWHATRQKDVVVPLEAGLLPVRFEYFQLDGAAELVLELHRVR